MQAMDVITTYPVKYVIVADPDFESALQPLVEWKTKKGFIVVEAYTNDPAVGVLLHQFMLIWKICMIMQLRT